jgi:hypothetical protein
VQALNLGRGKRYFSSSERPDLLLGPPSLFQYVLVPFPGLKRPGYDVSQSPPSSPDVRNEWRESSVASVCLHGMKTNNFTFTFTFLIGYEVNL